MIRGFKCAREIRSHRVGQSLGPERVRGQVEESKGSLTATFSLSIIRPRSKDVLRGMSQGVVGVGATTRQP